MFLAVSLGRMPHRCRLPNSNMAFRDSKRGERTARHEGNRARIAHNSRTRASTCQCDIRELPSSARAYYCATGSGRASSCLRRMRLEGERRSHRSRATARSTRLHVGEIDLVVDALKVYGLDLLAREPAALVELLLLAEQPADGGEVGLRVGHDVAVQRRGDQLGEHVVAI